MKKLNKLWLAKVHIALLVAWGFYNINTKRPNLRCLGIVMHDRILNDQEEFAP